MGKTSVELHMYEMKKLNPFDTCAVQHLFCPWPYQHDCSLASMQLESSHADKARGKTSVELHMYQMGSTCFVLHNWFVCPVIHSSIADDV